MRGLSCFAPAIMFYTATAFIASRFVTASLNCKFRNAFCQNIGKNGCFKCKSVNILMPKFAILI